jgi:predicted nucleic acid-binding protein
METSKRGIIIADTSDLVSLFSPNDRNHVEAVEAAKRLQNEQRDILIPAAVFVEFLNIMGRKAGHAVAIAAAQELTPPFIILGEPQYLHESPALKKFIEVGEAVSCSGLSHHRVISSFSVCGSIPRLPPDSSCILIGRI